MSTRLAPRERFSCGCLIILAFQLSIDVVDVLIYNVYIILLVTTHIEKKIQCCHCHPSESMAVRSFFFWTILLQIIMMVAQVARLNGF
jgi:hypothetical protein